MKSTKATVEFAFSGDIEGRTPRLRNERQPHLLFANETAFLGNRFDEELSSIQRHIHCRRQSQNRLEISYEMGLIEVTKIGCKGACSLTPLSQ